MTLKDKTEYTNYRLKFKNKEHKIKGRDNYFKFLGCFFDTIGEELTENENGVYIEDLGYFFMWLSPKKIVWNTNGKDRYHFDTDMRIYMPTFIPVKEHREWTMDKTFSTVIKKELFESIVHRNKRYKMHLSYFKKKL